MLLDEIPSQTKVFIDSNIFIYHFLDVSESCTNFLERVERGYIDAYTSNTVLSEVMHRLMVAEVVEKYDVKPKGAIRYIKDNQEIIITLEKCEDAIVKIPQFGVKILLVTVESIFQSRELRKRYLLMTNDSLNVHVMKSNQLYDIATNDGDFERVEEVSVWKPVFRG